MSFARTGALRSLRSSLGRHSGLRASPRTAAVPGIGRTQLAVGRRYASGGAGGGAHGHGDGGSDLPWLLGAVIVTPPACYYLWPDQSHAEHHGGEHEEHGEAHEEEKEGEEEAPAEESKPEPEQQEEEKEGEQEQPKEEKKDDAPAQDTTAEQEEAKESEETAKPSGSEGESQPQSNDANKISSKTEEGTSEPKTKAGSTTTGKGHMKEGAPGHDDTRKREPDSKGAYKKRVDSGLQKDLGASDNPVSSDDENTSGPAGASTSKQAQKGSTGDVSSKQFGLSTTATRHSLQIDQDPEKSKKPEGPETAKSMGTIDPNRPQP